MPSKQILIFALGVLSIAIGVGLGSWWFASQPRAIATGEALVGGPFALTDQNGKRVTDQDFRGRYLLVAFGYTFCPDVCPTELQVMSAALDKLGPAGDGVQPILITVDPKRDTPAVLKEYMTNFHPRFVGLTGSEEEIAKAASAYRVFYQRAKGYETAQDYLMDHSALIFLMGPDGKFMKFFPYSTDPTALADGIKAAVAHNS